MGVTVFLVEQNASMALSLADRGYVLQTGKIVLGDTASKTILCAGPILAEDEKNRSFPLSSDGKLLLWPATFHLSVARHCALFSGDFLEEQTSFAFFLIKGK